MFLSKKRSEMDVFCFEEVANSGYIKKNSKCLKKKMHNQ